ncbi:hypothetical protein AO371_1693 [Moraxella catarrhalis]|jgi:hypothetical protein|uniref:hypothetical protein n=1 Tax=Moraxella catarrhalis TaxID=480 RepID=UPI0007E4B2BA|nr:hypothetical protein [Moraxella catarrhalis]OAV22979.1 hypothetical protein AO371_1693 [Moraxella catarrhalis]STY79365.1 Uncharacterised protein [Moraxella catarrhalis]
MADKDNQILWYLGIGWIVLMAVAYFYTKEKQAEEYRRDYAVAKQWYMEEETEKLASKGYLNIESGDDCTQDCSGHEAGFEWAKENEVGDVVYCEGTSQSFIEGCEAYVREMESIWNNPEDRPDFQEEVYGYMDAGQPDYDQ